MPEQLLEDSGLTALAQFVVTDGSLDDTLLRMAELACQVIPADMAGITLLAEGRPATGVFTDPQASELDTAQYSDDGPGQESFRWRRRRFDVSHHHSGGSGSSRRRRVTMSCAMSLSRLSRA
jgi:hypothetical protein